MTVVQRGLTYQDVRAIASDLFRENFLKLHGQAAVVAAGRAGHLVETFLSRLEIDNPDGFESAADPDFQHALWTAQREYARNGDESLCDLLVDVLIQRSKQNNPRSTLSISLNESLNVLAKITDAQIGTLALVFDFRYSAASGIVHPAQLASVLTETLEAYRGRVALTPSSYQHLEYAGCGSVGVLASSDLEGLLARTYRLALDVGFQPSDPDIALIRKESSIPDLIYPHPIEAGKVSISFNSEQALEAALALYSVPSDLATSIQLAYRRGRRSDQSVRELLVGENPDLAELFDMWNQSQMKNFMLTSVGMVIAQASLKHRLDNAMDATNWLFD